MFGFLITRFAVGMSVETFKSKKKLFKILMCQSYNSKVNSFLCCSSIFIMTRALPKAAILKLMQNIQLKVVIFMKIKNPRLRLTDC